MQVSIQWPYGSNLHCEILVDDQIVAQADQFIAPRFFRVKDDPLYGMLQCGAPLDIPARRRRPTPARLRRPPLPADAVNRRRLIGQGRQPVVSAHSQARR